VVADEVSLTPKVILKHVQSECQRIPYSNFKRLDALTPVHEQHDSSSEMSPLRLQQQVFDIIHFDPLNVLNQQIGELSDSSNSVTNSSPSAKAKPDDDFSSATALHAKKLTKKQPKRSQSTL
jgi:hypothetical protein